ncbi:hypothetical protein VTH82DRAFT_5323 [Thermothelomyces myriococcoides]
MPRPRYRSSRPVRHPDPADDSDSGSSCSVYSVSSDGHRAPIRDPRGFRLEEGEEGKAVYEAWDLIYEPGTQKNLGGFKTPLGIKIKKYQEIEGRDYLRARLASQSELADMHLQAIAAFREKRKRTWAARIFHGGEKMTYEQELNERCRRMPDKIKTLLSKLLSDRDAATSTLYRTRTWTVVALREQLLHRFAEAEHTDVRRHKFCRWKNPDCQEPILYTVIIRGVETKVMPDDEKGQYRPLLLGNPWQRLDETEARRRGREERERRRVLEQKRRSLSRTSTARSLSSRSRSPSYRTRARPRPSSPPSYRSSQIRPGLSPSPSAPLSRSDSPPPYRHCVRSESPADTRPPSVHFPALRHPLANVDNDTLFPPAHHESFTAPPRDAPAIYSPCNPDTSSRGMPDPALPFYHPRPLFPAQRMQSPCGNIGGPYVPGIANSYQSSIVVTCPACNVTRALPCAHYPLHAPCTRPTYWHGGIPYHPPCTRCHGMDDGEHGPQQQQQQQQPISAHDDSPMEQFGQFDRGDDHPHPQPQHFQQHQFCGFHPSTVAAIAPRPTSWPLSSSSSLSSAALSSIPPLPPAPNPFSPLSTPALTSLGGGRSSAGGSSVGRSSPVIMERASASSAGEGGGVGAEAAQDGGEKSEKSSSAS